MRARPADCCPLCQSAGDHIYRNLEDRLFSAGGQWNLARCQNSVCGLLWMNPMPQVEDLGLAYLDYFTHEGTRESPVRRICLWLYRTLNALPGLVSGLYSAQKQMACMFLADVSPGKLLDVGCGDGRFLHSMKARGWIASGVEVDCKAVEQAKKKFGLDVKLGTLAEANFPESCFDAVTLRHVIEHLPDPVGVLRECRRVLKPGGRLVVVTPNTASLGHQLFAEHWLGLDQPRHLMIYSPSSIALCARQSGLDNYQVITSAANAETVFAVSFSLTRRKHHAMDLSVAPELGRALKAIWWQHREAWRMKHQPLIGEELVLLATK